MKTTQRQSMIPANMYVPIADLRKLPEDKRLAFIEYILKNDRCIHCIYAEWQITTITHEYVHDWVLDEYLTKCCFRHHGKGTTIKNVNRIVFQCKHCQTNTLDMDKSFNNLKELIGEKNLGKILDLPPPIDKSKISRNGSEVLITGAKIETDVHTQMGNVPKAIIMSVEYGDSEEGYQIFSIPDDKPIGGSIARLLRTFLPKLEDSKNLNDTMLQAFKDKTVLVKNIADKLYWYTM